MQKHIYESEVIMKENNANVNVLKAHVALNVRNVEASIAFYRKMFGLEPSKVRTGYAKFDVQNPPLNLSLNQNPFENSGALSHLGLQVTSTEDVLAMKSCWASEGLATQDEMGTNCCYAIQDKTWVRDPDGNAWEVFVVHQDYLPESTTCCTPEQEGASASSCSTPTNFVSIGR
jgi:catechol 2,3-dioxygenase-like lactoylglutathione lyase family enzyme